MEIPEIYTKRVVVLGCGNVLFGDDGFGPAAVEYIQKNHTLPEDACVVDAGTAAGKLLFTMLVSEQRPEKLIVIDAFNVGKNPGEIFELSIEDLPKNKVADFSLHRFPSANLLKLLREEGVDITILACQVERIPELVEPGLSSRIEKTLPKVAERVLEKIKD
jgi:coenzyme F420 hydrogenase subunit delta